MVGLSNFKINSKEDLKFISKGVKIQNVHVNIKCKLDGYYFENLYINEECIIINCIVEEEVVINNPNKFILIRNCMIGNLKCFGIGNNNASIHIEHNIIYDGVMFEKFYDLGKNVSIYVYQNQLDSKLVINNNFVNENTCAMCVACNRFLNANQNNFIAEIPEYIDVKDNYCLNNYKIKFIDFKKFPNYSGYNRKYLGNAMSLFVLESEFKLKKIEQNRYMRIKNISQYVSNDNDPALQTGCEATSCAIALNYVLKQEITKNEMAAYLEIKDSGEASFWDAFIGDIYTDGFGCMSSVVVKAINKYLKEKGFDKDYYVVNTTNMPLYELLGFVNSKIPVIVWCTMGNNDHMYHKKNGSTKWDINGNKLYWPGNEHCVVIAGYSFTRGTIYLMDPENEDTRFLFKERNLYEFENRFTELYSQSIVILRKRNTR
ncbi:MAG: hypothetical protein E7183_01750 [Erysipelotrichaceae bacterium]|nr:hypothetical protein [Erysipelotrichaceae bacterium]